jgi:hypothetical protein
MTSSQMGKNWAIQSNYKKVDKKFSAAWSSLPVFRFWLAADCGCIIGCLA